MLSLFIIIIHNHNSTVNILYFVVLAHIAPGNHPSGRQGYLGDSTAMQRKNTPFEHLPFNAVDAVPPHGLR